MPWWSLFMKPVDPGIKHWLLSVDWEMTAECRVGIIATKMFWRHQSDLQLVNASSLGKYKGKLWQLFVSLILALLFSFVAALHCCAFEPTPNRKIAQFLCLWKHKFPRGCSEFIFGPSGTVHLTFWQHAPPQAFHGGLSPLVSTVPTDWFSL